MYRVFLDMDGVLVDFIGGAARACKKPNPYLDAQGLIIRPPCMMEWDLAKTWGITDKKFWSQCRGHNFWANLEPTPWSAELVELACDTVGRNNVFIATSHSEDGGCVTGKTAWLETHFPNLVPHAIFTKAKKALATPKSLLIDDLPRNIQSFREAGGFAITFPAGYNNMYWDCANPMFRVSKLMRTTVSMWSDSKGD